MKPQKFDINNLRVATSCPASWENMTGDERKRFCASCSLHVYNISEMTAPEVSVLIGASGGRLCGRLYRRTDGTVITKDCPTGIRALRKRTARFAGAVFSAILGLFSFSFAQNEKPVGADGKEISGPVLKNERTPILAGKRILMGKIVDYQSKIAPDVEIVIYPKGSDPNDFKNAVKTVSGPDGKYVFDGLTAGSYFLDASSPGYARSETVEVNIEDGVQITLDIRLNLPEPLTGIITMMMIPPKQREPGTIVLDRETLDRMPHRRIF
jgi:hypothetical protein